jgi:hypothetical protein
MSYTPGTILSIGFSNHLEEVVVLSDNRVATKTFAGKPVERRDIMTLADWQILAVNKRIDVSFVPGTAPATAPSEESYPVNTMLRWVGDESNKRWAIVLKDGILQVKEMIMSCISFDAPSAYGYRKTSQKFFSSLADWKSTLPAGGTLTSQAGKDHSIEAKVAAPITATTDAEYINELKKRFHVSSRINKMPTDRHVRNTSFNTLQIYAGYVQTHMETIKNLTTDTALAASKIYSALRSIRSSIKGMSHASNAALAAQSRLMYTPNEQGKEPYIFKNNYRPALYAFVGDKKIEITSSDDLIGLAYNKQSGVISKHVIPTIGKTFAELGLQMKADGKPRLVAHYRRKVIEL